MFRNQGASKSNYFVGGVRVSTTWAEAVAVKATTPSDPTALDQVELTGKAHKVFVNGQMLIERNGELFNMTGARIQ
jgi:hypothetical protein